MNTPAHDVSSHNPGHCYVDSRPVNDGSFARPNFGAEAKRSSGSPVAVGVEARHVAEPVGDVSHSVRTRVTAVHEMALAPVNTSGHSPFSITHRQNGTAQQEGFAPHRGDEVAALKRTAETVLGQLHLLREMRRGLSLELENSPAQGVMKSRINELCRQFDAEIADTEAKLAAIEGASPVVERFVQTRVGAMVSAVRRFENPSHAANEKEEARLSRRGDFQRTKELKGDLRWLKGQERESGFIVRSGALDSHYRYQKEADYSSRRLLARTRHELATHPYEKPNHRRGPQPRQEVGDQAVDGAMEDSDTIFDDERAMFAEWEREQLSAGNRISGPLAQDGRKAQLRKYEDFRGSNETDASIHGNGTTNVKGYSVRRSIVGSGSLRPGNANFASWPKSDRDDLLVSEDAAQAILDRYEEWLQSNDVEGALVPAAVTVGAGLNGAAHHTNGVTTIDHLDEGTGFTPDDVSGREEVV